MDKSVDATRQKFQSVRAGRATPSLLDRINVEYLVGVVVNANTQGDRPVIKAGSLPGAQAPYRTGGQ